MRRKTGTITDTEIRMSPWEVGVWLALIALAFGLMAFNGMVD